MSERLKRVDVILGNYHPEKYKILTSVMDRPNAELIKDLIDSGLKGRGGAGFLTGLKWKFAAQAQSDEKYVICNADEGEPGTFKDREILSKVPRKVLSGMGICAKVIGAKKGYIYLRGEYKFLVPQLNIEIDEFHGFCDKLGLDFRVEIFLGSGAYVCGEETALLNSIEGRRGEPRNKPPFPTNIGLFDKPTVINNVETLVSAMMVCKIGPDQFKKLGIQDSHGSKLFSVSGDTPRAGIYDLEFGPYLYPVPLLPMNKVLESIYLSDNGCFEDFDESLITDCPETRQQIVSSAGGCYQWSNDLSYIGYKRCSISPESNCQQSFSVCWELIGGEFKLKTTMDGPATPQFDCIGDCHPLCRIFYTE